MSHYKPDNSDKSSQAPPGKGAGKTMAIFAWLVGMFLLTQFFGSWEKEQYNPNQIPKHSFSNKENIVTLQQNRWGHYVVNGQVNQNPATFMVDTGATDVSIPYALASYYDLKPRGEQNALTANGIVTTYKATIGTLNIGSITLRNVPASLNPGMEKSQSILLGMSALKQLELVQAQNQLVLTQRQ